MGSIPGLGRSPNLLEEETCGAELVATAVSAKASLSQLTALLPAGTWACQVGASRTTQPTHRSKSQRAACCFKLFFVAAVHSMALI